MEATTRYRLDYDPLQKNYNGKGDDMPGKAYLFDTKLNRRLTDIETKQLYQQLKETLA